MSKVKFKLPDTEQEVFNIIWTRLKAQGFGQSMGDEGCQYRGDNGRCCAAGAVIPDEAYNPEWEGVCWGDLVGSGHVPVAHLGLLCDAQEAHDVGVTPEMMERLLRKVADRHGLKVPA